MKIPALRRVLKAGKVGFRDCESQVIARIGYIRAERTLIIVFKSGASYAYHEVPAKEYQELIQAWSHGTYFSEAIRDRFVCTKL